MFQRWSGLIPGYKVLDQFQEPQAVWSVVLLTPRYLSEAELRPIAENLLAKYFDYCRLNFEITDLSSLRQRHGYRLSESRIVDLYIEAPVLFPCFELA